MYSRNQIAKSPTPSSKAGRKFAKNANKPTSLFIKGVHDFSKNTNEVAYFVDKTTLALPEIYQLFIEALRELFKDLSVFMFDAKTKVKASKKDTKKRVAEHLRKPTKGRLALAEKAKVDELKNEEVLKDLTLTGVLIRSQLKRFRAQKKGWLLKLKVLKKLDKKLAKQ